MRAVAVAPLERNQIGTNADGYGQGKTSKGLRQGFYLPISDVLRLVLKRVAVKEINN